MRTNDIEVGKEYAYKRDSYSTPQRVRVLATGVTREYYPSRSTWSRYPSKAQDGIQILVLNDDGTDGTRVHREYKDVEVTPARITRNGGIVPAVTKSQAVETRIPDVDIVRPAQIISSWEDAVDAATAASMHKERVEAANQKRQDDIKKAQAWSAQLLGRRSSITGTGEYSDTARRYVYGAPRINEDELLNLLRLADLAVSAGLDTQE